jgi:hypothetical protein
MLVQQVPPGPAGHLKTRFGHFETAWDRVFRRNRPRGNHGWNRQGPDGRIPITGIWFWIEDRDQKSKQILSFLMIKFSLTEGGPSQGAPIVTSAANHGRA